MRKSRVGLTWLTAAAVAVAALSGCSAGDNPSGGGDDEGFVIGFSDGQCDASWRQVAEYGLKKEADRLIEEGVISKYINLCADADIPKQIQDINSLVAQGADAILTIPLSGSSIGPVLAAATERGIVTVPFNLPVEGTDYTSYVGTDTCEKATVWATWLSEQAKGKPGGVVGLGGTPGNSATAVGWDCATKVFEENGIETLDLKYVNWTADQAKSATASLIAAYPDISGVWTDSGINAFGAAQAFIDAGKPIPPMVGDDYNGVIKLALQEGFEYGCVSEPPDGQAIEALHTAIAALKGEDVEKRVTIPATLITGEDALAKLARPDLPDNLWVNTDLTTEEIREAIGG